MSDISKYFWAGLIIAYAGVIACVTNASASIWLPPYIIGLAICVIETVYTYIKVTLPYLREQLASMQA